MIPAVILLGTNLNDRRKNLEEAIRQIDQRIGVIEMASGLYRTAPWGNTNQDDFLNQVVVVKTSLSPRSLLNELLLIESQMGRVRSEKWAARLIDLDILYYGHAVIHEKGLDVPHPYLQDRRFTLVPLAEILPDFMHPELNKTNAELLAQTADFSEVFLLESGK